MKLEDAITFDDVLLVPAKSVVTPGHGKYRNFCH